MFHFSPFRFPGRQRRELLSATSYGEIPLHPAVERQLAKIRTMGVERSPHIRSVWGLFFWVFGGVRDLIREVALWSGLGALVVLVAVFITRELFQPDRPVLSSMLLAALFLGLKLLQAAIDFKNQCRRLQVHRGVQAALFLLVNQKLADIAPVGRERFSKGQLKTLVGSDVESIEDFLSAALQQFVPLTISCAVLLPALWLVSGTAGLVGMGTALAVLPLAMLGAWAVEIFQQKAQFEQDRLTTAIGEWVKNIRLVRFLGWGGAVEREVNDQLGRYILISAIRHGAVIIVWALSYSWSMLPLLSLFLFASSQGESVSLMEVFSSFWLLDHIVTQLQWVPYSLSMYGSAAAGARRFLDLLNQPNLSDALEPSPPGDEGALGEPVAVVFRGVTVRHNDTLALNRLDVELSLEQRTAIVGSVGSGKTTLLEALIGELPISEGSIDVRFSCGRTVPLWRADAFARLRSAIAYSPQQPFLSNASVRLNIDLSGQCSLEDVQMAVMASQLSQDLALFPRGLEEEVGESGINLSGGQKQRVSLGRVFISQRSIMILDDPLSAVDAATEKALMDAILFAAKGLVMVSHRLAELERCDRVLVLRDGAIAEDGNPKQLARRADSEFSRFLLALEEHER